MPIRLYEHSSGQQITVYEPGQTDPYNLSAYHVSLENNQTSREFVLTLGEPQQQLMSKAFQPGWHMVSGFQGMDALHEDEILTWDEAVNAGWITNSVYAFDNLRSSFAWRTLRKGIQAACHDYSVCEIFLLELALDVLW